MSIRLAGTISIHADSTVPNSFTEHCYCFRRIFGGADSRDLQNLKNSQQWWSVLLYGIVAHQGANRKRPQLCSRETNKERKKYLDSCSLRQSAWSRNEVVGFNKICNDGGRGKCRAQRKTYYVCFEPTIANSCEGGEHKVKTDQLHNTNIT